MACTPITLKGINAICKEGKGGVTRVWVAPFEDIEAEAITVDEATQTISIKEEAIAKLVAYGFRRNSASFTQTLEVNENAGNTINAELTLDFLKQDAVKRLEISALLAGATRVIVEDANGVMHLMGYTYPVEASAATVETGTAISDANHYSITLSDQDDKLAYILDEDTAKKVSAIKPTTV